jgi:hypothetical protein
MNKIFLIPIASILISISCILVVINIPKGNFMAIAGYIYFFFPLLVFFQIISLLLFVISVKKFNKIPKLISFFNILIVTIFIYITLAYVYGTT